MEKIGVVGAGSFGTALAVMLAKKGHDVTLTSHRAEQIEELKRDRENKHYLPGVKLEENLKLTADYDEALDGTDVMLLAAPSSQFRTVFEHTVPYITDKTVIVNVAKGVEKPTLLRLSEVAHILRRDLKYVTLSGPSHAEEVGRFLPTTVVVSSEDMSAAEYIQDVFMTDRFRVYTNDDLCGVEMGGALKNIIALGAGISDGIGYGDNAKAALMTRGIAEITRLGVAVGAKPETFSGLTGDGDMSVTCTSMHSRNRRCGMLIGEGVPPAEAVRQVGQVVEGIDITEAAYTVARRRRIDMPITECIYQCLQGEITAAETVGRLMNRDKKSEMGQ